MLLKEPEMSVFGTNRTSRAGLMKEVEDRKRELQETILETYMQALRML